MFTVTPKWSAFGTSIFSLMTQAAQRCQAVNLAQGFPSFDGPEEIKEHAIAAIRGPHNQYAPSPGIFPLREALAHHQKKRYGLSYDPQTEVTVFSGATEALFCAFQAFFSAGDEVLAFAPFFDCYPTGCFSVGAKLKEVKLRPPHWEFSRADLEKALTPKTKGLILNTPHNPTGRVFSREEMQTVADFAKTHGLLVITDEVYEEITFDGVPHISFASLAGMREQTVVISSCSKTFSMTGWKVGYAFAPANLMAELRGVHQFSVFCSATPLEEGMRAGFALGEEYFEQLRADYTKRRDLLAQALTDVGFEFFLPQGTYFIMADYRKFSQLPDKEFALWMTEKIGVAVLPTSVFYENPEETARQQFYVRFAFCKDLAMLEDAALRLKKLTR